MLKLAHKQLEVYQIAMKLVKEVYAITENFPKDERFVLISQIRRAVVSVCSNIAEGAARKSGVERKRFYEIARSSLVEIDTQLEIALNLNYINKEKMQVIGSCRESVFRMLNKMIDKAAHTTIAH